MSVEMASWQEENTELRAKRKFMLTETSRGLVSRDKFYEAASRLNDIDEETINIGVKLLMVECYVRLGREMKSEKLMKNIRDILLKQPSANIGIVKSLADGYKDGDSSCVREIFIRKLLSDMYLLSDLPEDEKFDGAHKRLHEIQSVSERISKKKSSKPRSAFQDRAKKLPDDPDDESRVKTESVEDTRLQVIAWDYGVKYMLQIFDSLKRIEINVDPKKRALALAKCTNAIGYFYGVIKDHNRSIAIMTQGVQIMDEEFGNLAGNYNSYGDLHQNTGSCFYNLDRYKEAEMHYVKAIECYHRATDYPNEELRSRDLKKSESKLKNTRKWL